MKLRLFLTFVLLSSLCLCSPVVFAKIFWPMKESSAEKKVMPEPEKLPEAERHNEESLPQRPVLLPATFVNPAPPPLPDIKKIDDQLQQLVRINAMMKDSYLKQSAEIQRINEQAKMNRQILNNVLKPHILLSEIPVAPTIPKISPPVYLDPKPVHSSSVKTSTTVPEKKADSQG